MKKHISILLQLFLLLALSACETAPSITGPPDIVDTRSPPPEAEGIVPLSCDEIGEVFAYDPQAPLDIQETSRSREWDVTIIDLTYASPKGGRVPATLVVPDGAGPFAGMLYQHGMPSTRKNFIRFAVNYYARRGAVVLLIDAPFVRRANGLDRPMTGTEQDRREQIQLIIDLRRGVDLLLSRPDVDPERLAYVGGSYGGRMGGLLAGVEHRLKAYVFFSGGGGLVSFVTDPERSAMWLANSESGRREWVAWMWPIEPIHYVGCASPAELLFQNGTLDRSSTPTEAFHYQEAGSEPKTILWYRVGHDLDATAYKDQVEWLSERVGISTHRPFPRSAGVLIASWAILVMVSLGVLGLDTWRTRSAPSGARLMWILTNLLLGPLGLLIYWISGRMLTGETGTPREISAVRGALGSAAWAAAGNVLGAIGVLALTLSVPLLNDIFNRYPVLQVALSFLLPFSAGALTFALCRWFSRSDARFRLAHSRPLFVEAVSTCLLVAVGFPTIRIVITPYIAVWPTAFAFDLFYARLWVAVCLAVLAGTILIYPFHLWMIRRGVIAWGLAPAEPWRGLAWYWKGALLLASFVLLLGAIFLSMQLV